MVEPHRAVLEVRRPLEEARARILERALWQEGQARAAACHLKGVRPPSVQACDEGTQEKHSADTSRLRRCFSSAVKREIFMVF